MNPIIFKVVKEYDKRRIERNYNNNFIISAWITQDQLKKQFQYIEKETENFDYFERQSKLTSLLKLLMTLTLFFTIIFGFNSSKDITIIIFSVLIILTIVTCIFKFIFWKWEYEDSIKEIKKIPDTFVYDISKRQSPGLSNIHSISSLNDNTSSAFNHDEWDYVDHKHRKEHNEKTKDKKVKLKEDYLRIFIEENTIETNTRRYKCNLCKGFKNKLEYPKIKNHFIDFHEKDYNNSSYAQIATFFQAIQYSDECDEQENDDELDEDLFNDIFGKKTKKNDIDLLKELEKMMGFGMGNDGFTGKTKKKKK